VTRGVAWSAPLAAISVAAPAYAASLRKDPGINGWVQVTTNETSTDGTYNVRFDSTPNGTGPDGAPFGLYIYDVNQAPDDKFQNARITIWLNDAQSSVTRSTLAGHSALWADGGSLAAVTKPDGFSYTGYRYTYTGPILASSYVTDPIDGVKRLYLGDLHVNLLANQSNNGAAANMTYWVERYIEVQVSGSGPYLPRSFQRRNGQRGPLGNGFPGGGSFRSSASAGLFV
jgi:hypothetical protein